MSTGMELGVLWTFEEEVDPVSLKTEVGVGNRDWLGVPESFIPTLLYYAW